MDIVQRALLADRGRCGGVVFVVSFPIATSNGIVVGSLPLPLPMLVVLLLNAVVLNGVLLVSLSLLSAVLVSGVVLNSKVVCSAAGIARAFVVGISAIAAAVGSSSCGVASRRCAERMSCR